MSRAFGVASSSLSPQEVAALRSGLACVPVLKPNRGIPSATATLSPAQCYQLELIQVGNLEVVLGRLGVLPEFTTTTNLKATRETFDMEARTAVSQICGERIMSGNGEVYVQPKMTQLLFDTVNHDGAPMSMDRHGLSRTMATKPTTQASFEQSGFYLGRAANRGDYDDLSQLSSATILGRTPDGMLGTAVCSIATTPATNNASSALPSLMGDEDALLRTFAGGRPTVPSSSFDEMATAYVESLVI